MTLTALGKIVVTTAGTPVPLTADTTLRANKLEIAPANGNTGIIFVGATGLVKATGVGVIRALPPLPTSGQGDVYAVDADEGNPIYLSQYAIDASVSGEGAYVTYQTE